MRYLKQKIESMMQSDFPGNTSALGVMLYSASMLYRGGVKIRSTGYDSGVFQVRRLPCRVISVGNITVGGTGKTPMTIYLARRLKHMGYRPAVLSRGYGGRAEKKGTVVSNGFDIFCGPEMAGDEPVMMASRLNGIPVLVGADRYESGLRALTEFDPDIILLDDAFQHRRLHRDVDLVLLDARRLFGNGHLFPRGMLREPVAGLRRSDGIILTRTRGQKSDELLELIGSFTDKPVFRTDHVPYVAGIYKGQIPLPAGEQPGSLDFLGSSKLYVFSGIARNREFVDMLGARGGKIMGSESFIDHHRYTDEELRRIFISAGKTGADFLVTTEKDYVRIIGRVPDQIPLVVIGVDIEFAEGDARAFLQFVREKLMLANHRS